MVRSGAHILDKTQFDRVFEIRKQGTFVPVAAPDAVPRVPQGASSPLQRPYPAPSQP